MFNGKGVVLTSDEFEEEVKRQRERREGIVAEREKNKELRASKKVAKAVMETRWAEMTKEHESAVERWLAMCRALEAQNVPKKEWPKRPNRPLRRDLEAKVAFQEETLSDIVDAGETTPN